ncbi:unnamed protein product [Merluccius merluccius]
MIGKVFEQQNAFAQAEREAPLETAAMPADDTEDAAAPKKKALGSFFKVTEEGNNAGPALQQDQAIALELQSYLL